MPVSIRLILSFPILALLSWGCATDRPVAPHIVLDDHEAFFDRELGLRVAGLEAGAEVTLEVDAIDARDQLWQSRNVYVVGSDGGVDLSRDAPREGSYTGAHAMGPFWSMVGAERFYTDGPATVGIRVREGETVVAEAAATWLAPRNDPSVVSEPIRGPELQANLWLPAESDGKLPAVIVVGGSGGGFNSERASLLASRGYAALDVGYFEVEGRPEYFVESVPLEYFMNAIDVLAADPRIDASRVAVMGKSYGAQLVMLWASYDPRIRAVVAEAPSSFVTGTSASLPDGPYASAWSFEGRQFPYLSGGNPDQAPANPLQINVDTAGSVAIDRRPEARVAAIPAERIEGAVLLISGDDDKIWEATPMCRQLIARMQPARGFDHEARHVRYADAGHNLGGGQQAYGVPNLPPKDRGDSRGGSRQGNSVAGAAAWREVLAFLERELAP